MLSLCLHFKGLTPSYLRINSWAVNRQEAYSAFKTYKDLGEAEKEFTRCSFDL